MIKSARWLWIAAAGLAVSGAAAAGPAGSGDVPDPAHDAATQDPGSPVTEPVPASAPRATARAISRAPGCANFPRRDPLTMVTDRPDYQLRTMAQLAF